MKNIITTLRAKVTPRQALIVAASVAGAALVAVIALGVVLGQAVSHNSEALERNVALTGTVEDLEGEVHALERNVDSITLSRDGYKGAAEDVAARDTEVTEREIAVQLREDAITLTEQTVKASQIGNGKHTVGITMEEGTYATTTTNTSCYWAVYTSGTNYSDIVENDFGGTGTLFVTVGAGQDFETDDCGTWTRQ